MTAFQLQTPFAFFVDTNGKPLDAGYIWIGAANTNPEETQIPVFWDDALTIPAVQPIRTVGGYPSRNGSAAQVFAGQYYAITVRNKHGELVFSNAFAADMVAAQLLTMAANRVEQTFDTVYGTSLYPLNFDPASAALMLVTLNGVVQSAGDHFSLAAMPSAPSGKGIQFVDTAIPTGYRVDVVFDKPINYAVANQVSMDFATLAEFQAAVTAGLSLPDGRLVTAAGTGYVAETGAVVTSIPAGWRPARRVWTEAELIATTDPVSPGQEIIEVNVADEIVFYRREPGAAGPDDITAGDGSDWAKASLTSADLLAAVTDVTTAAEFITYAAGQFTPVLTALTPGTMSVSGGTTRGSYTRIGNRVFVDIAFVGVTVSLGTASGEIIISGLPYTSAANTYGHGQLRRSDGVDLRDLSSGVPANVSYRVAPSDTKGRLFIIPANANAFNAPVARLGATVTLEIVGSYEVLP